MLKSELIRRLTAHQSQMTFQDVELSINGLLNAMAQALESGEGIEIRGFGSFRLRVQPRRVGRNPKNGASVVIPPKGKVRFKPSRQLIYRINQQVGA